MGQSIVVPARYQSLNAQRERVDLSDDMIVNVHTRQEVIGHFTYRFQPLADLSLCICCWTERDRVGRRGEKGGQNGQRGNLAACSIEN